MGVKTNTILDFDEPRRVWVIHVTRVWDGVRVENLVRLVVAISVSHY